MRISDWSSDVCSSDLQHLGPRCERGLRAPAWAKWHAGDRARRRGGARGVPTARLPREVAQGGAVMTRSASRRRRLSLACALTLCSAVALGGCATFGGNRSEEHTSELQSLMRNSYAVSCLKKKK